MGVQLNGCHLFFYYAAPADEQPDIFEIVVCCDVCCFDRLSAILLVEFRSKQAGSCTDILLGGNGCHRVVQAELVVIYLF